MLTLTLRTDTSETELGLYEDQQQIAYHSWQSGRELSTTLHKTIEKLLKEKGKTWRDLSGIIVFKGPGSFTGLRIGLTVANTLAYSLKIPIVSTSNDNWVQIGFKRLIGGEDETVALPEYGAEPNISTPRK